MNPFKEKAKKPEEFLSPLEKLYPKPYDKNETSPYTKTRIILACGAEVHGFGIDGASTVHLFIELQRMEREVGDNFGVFCFRHIALNPS